MRFVVCFGLLTCYSSAAFKVSLLWRMLLVVPSSFDILCKPALFLLSLSALGFGVNVLLGHLLI